MANEAQLLEGELARDIGSLALSCVTIENPMTLVRAASWQNAFTRVGVSIPWYVVHDVGALFTVDPRAMKIGARPFAKALDASASTARDLDAWTRTLKEIAATEVVEKARGWRLSDDLLTVVLLRILSPIYRRYSEGRRIRANGILPLSEHAYRELDTRLPELFRAHRRELELQFLAHLASESLRLVTAIEQIDLDTLRLLGLFGEEAGAMSALSMLDLLDVLGSPDANDVVNFSLDLLPSVLETRRAGGEQRMAIDGYAGFARHGAIDSLVLSELAYDEDLFDRRFVENEVFYYSREKAPESVRTLHYICVDASASMRGKRATFARGLTLTLMKKFSLRGEDVMQRFFDSQLYDVTQVRSSKQRQNANFHLPRILTFVGEHGRHYAKVFRALADELRRVRERERVNVVLYILTHAECHIPADVVAELARHARLYGIFMLPSTQTLDLDYLAQLDTVQVVDENSLVDKSARARRALDIVDDAASADSRETHR